MEKKIAENFPNLGKETDIQVQESQRVPKEVNPMRSTPRHLIIKMAIIKERILKAAKATSYMQGNKTISCLFSRNFDGQ